MVWVVARATVARKTISAHAERSLLMSRLCMVKLTRRKLQNSADQIGSDQRGQATLPDLFNFSFSLLSACSCIRIDAPRLKCAECRNLNAETRRTPRLAENQIQAPKPVLYFSAQARSSFQYQGQTSPRRVE